MDNKDIFKIVVVSSSAFLNETFKKILSSGICVVEYYQDGLRCIKCAAENPPAMIFIDMSLSGFFSMDVLKVLDSLKLNKTIPIIAMILDSQQNILPSLIDLGVSTVLYKPFTRNDLLGIVNNFLGEKIKSKTEKMPVLEAVKINSSFQKSGSSQKTEKMLKIKTLTDFLKSINDRKEELLNALAQRRNSELIRKCNELHNIGSIIGYPRLSLLCAFLGKKLINNAEEGVWVEIEKYTLEVLGLFEIIYKENLHFINNTASIENDIQTINA